VDHARTFIFFVDETGLEKPASVFGAGFKVQMQFVNDLLQGNAIAFGDDVQNGNPMVIGDALDMSLNLFRRFRFFWRFRP